jgi:hypothetical protein
MSGIEVADAARSGIEALGWFVGDSEKAICFLRRSEGRKWHNAALAAPHHLWQLLVALRTTVGRDAQSLRSE